MHAKASTHRLEPDVQAALDRLSQILGRPKNRLINEAVRWFVQQRSREEEEGLEATLKALRELRRSDPDFDQAISAVVREEAGVGRRDPFEGQVVAPAGSRQQEIRRLLHA